MSKIRSVGLAALIFLASGLPPASAQDDTGSILDAIGQDSAAGRYEDAWKHLQALEAELWEKRPLGISRALFVARPATGFGVYVPRENADFQKGETLYIYIEPIGYGYERAEDTFRVAMSADFELRTPTGQVLAEQTDFSKLTLESRSANREFQTSFSFAFEGLDAGRYELLIRIRDENGGDPAETTLPFTVLPSQDPETPRQ